MRRNALKFSVEWLDAAPHRAPEERATFAEIMISLGNSNATLHFADQQPGTSIEMPTYSLAEGLALDWWRLFGSREEEISLRSYRNGYAVPDIRMRFDGAAFEVHSQQADYRNPVVQFWIGQSEVLSRFEAESELKCFITHSIDRLRAEGVCDTTVALRWDRIAASLEDQEERAFCEAAAALGNDPYEVSDEAVSMIEKSAGIFNGEALTEFLAGARGKNHARLLDWIAGARKMPSYLSRLGDLAGAALEAAEAKPAIEGEEGWARGYRRARAFRTTLGLRESDRLKSYKSLAKLLGNANFQPKAAVDGIRVLREDDERGVMLHLRQRASPYASSEQLFSLARGVGDVACFPESDVAPINDLLYAYRQRCGRAFAAEFLAPVREVRSMWEDGRDASSIADEFGVSERVIEHQLENEARIEQCA